MSVQSAAAAAVAAVAADGASALSALLPASLSPVIGADLAETSKALASDTLELASKIDTEIREAIDENEETLQMIGPMRAIGALSNTGLARAGMNVLGNVMSLARTVHTTAAAHATGQPGGGGRMEAGRGRWRTSNSTAMIVVPVIRSLRARSGGAIRARGGQFWGHSHLMAPWRVAQSCE